MKQNERRSFSSSLSRRQAIRKALAAAGGVVMASRLSAVSLGVAPEDGPSEPQLPDVFPANLRRATPVKDLNDAVVFTINEETHSDYAVELARRTGADVLIRCWFKWHEAPPVKQWLEYPGRIHQLGGLFGGGITCSALFEGENGLTPAQVSDMATRGADGEFVNAWGHAGVRHGSLSSPAYLDYLFRWCREQIDAGVDYLFMDEHNAALTPNEGFDDHSLADFREFLLDSFPETRGWSATDPRWQTTFHIDLADRRMCPDGGMGSFSYRAFLWQHQLVGEPNGPGNPLAEAWGQFRHWRNDRSWKAITDQIRAYAASKGRFVAISANGLVHYADLQVAGIWPFMVKADAMEMSTNLLPTWRKLVAQGHDLAGKRVPVVFFHDWGAVHPPMPWMALTPEQRKLWMRVRGAEIYAAGGFFAFPVLGPHDCDAGRDGTLATLAQQTRFYQTHRHLYSQGECLGCQTIQTATPDLSLAVWSTSRSDEVALHIVNHQFENGDIHPRSNVTLSLPLATLPKTAVAISPDWPGQRPVACARKGESLNVTLNELDAYTVVLLRFRANVDISALRGEASAQ